MTSEVVVLDLEIYNIFNFGVVKEAFHVKLWVQDLLKYVRGNRHTPALQEAIIELGLMRKNRGFIESTEVSGDGKIFLVINRDLETQEETPATHPDGFEPKVGDLVVFRGWDHANRIVGPVRGLIVEGLEVPGHFKVFIDGYMKVLKDTEMRPAGDCDRDVEIRKILDSIGIIMSDRPDFPYKDLVLAACV